jgi:AcrR family transcriptional regulator
MLSSGAQNKRRNIRQRDPERTRDQLLQAACSEIYRSGFQGTDLDTVVERARVTKGALYHHFKGKEALGFAVVKMIAENTRNHWMRPLQQCANPIDTLVDIVERTSLLSQHVHGGCPLNNLSQEMSPLDEGFRKKTAKVFTDWQAAIATALRDGQTRGQVLKDIDPGEAATFLVAVYEGYISLAKNAQEQNVLRSGIRRITGYLESLRAA